MREDLPPRPPSSATKPPLGAPLARKSSNQASYTQAAGTAQRGRERSRTLGAEAHHREQLEDGKRRYVFCDVVLDYDQVLGGQPGPDGRERLRDGDVTQFVQNLGAEIDTSTVRARPPSTRPATPGKTPRVELSKVASHLKELYTTELSYFRKINALNRNLAERLRQFSRNPSTSIVNQFDAKHLFSNIEEIVTISETFKRDLGGLVEELEENPGHIPARVGEVILRNIERMSPYKEWLANVSQAEAVYQRLISSNASFVNYVDSQIQICRDEADTTSGFKELLAEPFQRISRYRLLLDPIRDHLPQTDESVPHLREAIRLIDTICSMEVDETIQQAATMWSLKRSITSFPTNFIRHDRHLIATLDVTESFEVSGSPTTLRCTLFLFNDLLLIAKRPSGEKGGRVLCGLDDMDNLARFYRSEVTEKRAPPASVRKTKRDALGFRGSSPLDAVYPVDLGGSSFGLVFDQAPYDLGGDKWGGRPARRYAVAATYAPDVRRVEKDNFLMACAERRALFGARGDLGGLPRKSKRIWDGQGCGDSVVVFWSVWDRPFWEKDEHQRRAKLALQLDSEDAHARELVLSGPKIPQVLARATFRENGLCCFAVRSTDGTSEPTAEVIGRDRIPGAIDSIATSYALFSLPLAIPRTPTGSARKRPNSAHFTNPLDNIFGSARTLERAGSKASTATTTSRVSGQSSANNSGSGSPLAYGRHRRAESMSPGWYGSKSVGDVGSNTMDESFASEATDDDADVEVLNASSTFRASSASPGSFLAPPDARGRRRSSSLPPAAPPLLYSPEPARGPPKRVPVPFSAPIEQLSFGSPPPDRLRLSGRLMGPRQPGETPRSVSGTRLQSPAPPSHPTSSTPVHDYRPSPSPSPASVHHLHSPAPSPFARDSSPGAIPFARSNSPSPIPFSHPSPSPVKISLPTPPPREPSASPPGVKRALAPEASPRASPAKKVAALSAYGAPRRPGPETALTARIPSSGGRRSVSGGSAATGRRKGRVASGGSVATIRGRAPSPALVNHSSPVRKRDVFDEEGMDVDNGVSTDLPYTAPPPPPKTTADPFEKVREHVLDLRLKLSRQISTAALRTKENAAPGSPATTGLSRSPHTRNVFLKTATTSSLPADAVPKEVKPLDAAAILRWADRLGNLVEFASVTAEAKVLDAEAAAAQASEVEWESGGPRDAEFETLATERDLLADELVEVRKRLEQADARGDELQNERDQLAVALKATQNQNAVLRGLYSEMCTTVQDAYSGYQDDLGNLSLLIKETTPPDSRDLVDQLQQALLEKRTAQLDLEQADRDHQFALQEMEARLTAAGL
ncbi:hypothetical protein RQP46_007446 [Phenoliferia psychrophenolica]